MSRCSLINPFRLTADPLNFAELDFDALSLSEPSPSSSSAPAPSSSHATASESDIVQALRAQLADSNQALDQLKTIIKDRLGETMGLSGAKEMQEEVVVKKDTKGKGVEGEERDDDSHYFEVSLDPLLP